MEDRFRSEIRKAIRGYTDAATAAAKAEENRQRAKAEATTRATEVLTSTVRPALEELEAELVEAGAAVQVSPVEMKSMSERTGIAPVVTLTFAFPGWDRKVSFSFSGVAGARRLAVLWKSSDRGTFEPASFSESDNLDLVSPEWVHDQVTKIIAKAMAEATARLQGPSAAPAPAPKQEPRRPEFRRT